MSGWFGPATWGAPVCEPARRLPIPEGQLCLHCQEAIGDQDSGIMMPHADAAGVSQQPLHLECHLRMIIGGANHQLGTCSCCGGDQPPDPPGLSRREAAILAEDVWRMLMRRKGGTP